MGTVRVVLVDDHEVVRLGLISLLEDVAWVEVVAEAGTAAEAVACVATHQPDAVIMDIRLPGDSGIEACHEITRQWPDTRVIMLTSHVDDELIFRALQANACGYVLKQVGNQALVEALNRVRHGESLLDPIVVQRDFDRLRASERAQQENVFRALTEREMIVLARIAEGMSNERVAASVSVSEQTVCNDINSILAKLGVSNRFAAAIYANRHNIRFYLAEGA
jgi:DNA-binding NarL/FixJ family response regulator